MSDEAPKHQSPTRSARADEAGDRRTRRRRHTEGPATARERRLRPACSVHRTRKHAVVTPPIDFTKVRRVRVDDEGPTSHQARVAREMAQAANADREREGADDGR